MVGTNGDSLAVSYCLFRRFLPCLQPLCRASVGEGLQVVVTNTVLFCIIDFKGVLLSILMWRKCFRLC